MIKTMSDISKAVAAENHNGRMSMGPAGPSVSAPKGQGTSVPKKGTTSDPLALGAGTAGGRSHTETLGAAYRIKQTFPARSPESQPTMANARIIPPSHSREKGFYSHAAGL